MSYKTHIANFKPQIILSTNVQFNMNLLHVQMSAANLKCDFGKEKIHSSDGVIGV
jgi:hypothetical protein